MAYFYMPLVKVEVTSPLAAAWIDDVIKCRLAVEIATFNAYVHVHPQKQLEITTHFYAPLVASTSSTSDNTTKSVSHYREIDELFNAIVKTGVDLSPLNSQIEKYMGVQVNCRQSLKIDLTTLDAKQEALKKELEQLGQECNVTQA
ncbi:hypothetical protein CK203_053406 [Vitis vinifera]|uniref:Uncharacterized protein n=1 Tax=Vitis vinifera TaxID=29760 RepID=A0A438GZS5_VITVI|nr:hypothetical protein CK203_053406 [Vitis vinifera]